MAGPTVTRSLRGLVFMTLFALFSSTFAFLPASAAGSDPGRLGRWSAPFWEGGEEEYDPPSSDKARRYPTAASAIALPDGRLLYWNALEGSENGDLWLGKADMTIAVENARVRLLDLGSDEPTWTTSTLERGLTDEAFDSEIGATHDLFCSDQKLLYDGSVLVAGGSRWDVPEDTHVPEPRGVSATSVFDPRSDSFRPVGDMEEPRWYPSLVTLADGRILVTSGVRRAGYTVSGPDPAFSQVRLSEIYDPTTEGWEKAGVSEWSFPLYPRLHLLPDGKVFYGGAGQSWNPFGETADEASWALQRLYDPATKTWTTLGHSRYGVRSGASSALLRLEPPYDTADILVAGGTFGPTPGAWAGSTLSEIIRWTPEGMENVGDVKPPVAGLAGDATQLRNRRWFSTPTMLPTGEVFLVNGGDADDVLDPGSAAAVRTPELYDPETNTWTELASAGRDRIYHNTSVLLPDGRVLVGGHAPHSAHYFRYDNTFTRANNFRDATFEIYEPPYLFRGPRPVLSDVVPIRGGRAMKLSLGAGTSASEIAEVVLVRMGANTHSMDADMRAVKLEHSVAGSNVLAELPKDGDGRIVPPGPYYVFVLRDTPDGHVPSVAQTVLVRPGAGPPSDRDAEPRSWQVRIVDLPNR